MANKMTTSGPVEENSNPEELSSSNNEQNKEEENGQSKTKTLVRLRKTIIFDSTQIGHARIDRSILSAEFYNRFNYWLLPKEQLDGCLTFGITSAKIGDGKSLVASNLAVSFAVANDKKTLLVDMNLRRPVIHKIFGTRKAPGFLNALRNLEIQVTETPFQNLCILPAGGIYENPVLASKNNTGSGNHFSFEELHTLGLDRVTDFRDVVYSLKQVFEVVIFDLPSVNEAELPRLYFKQLGGLIVVVNAGQTRQEEIDALQQYVHESQILGFVFNRTEKD
jgi:Mrp family chromosome partitioning ATPase